MGRTPTADRADDLSVEEARDLRVGEAPWLSVEPVYLRDGSVHRQTQSVAWEVGTALEVNCWNVKPAT